AGLAPGDPGLTAAVLEWAALARTSARERLDADSIATATAEAAHTEAMSQLAETRELARRQRQYADAERCARDLEARSAEREETRQRLERARAAAGVAPAVALEETRQRLERARAAAGVAPAVALHTSASSAHEEALAGQARHRRQLPPELGDAPADELTRLAGEFRQELGSLEAARRSEQRRHDVEAELAALERESRTDEEALREASEWLSGWDGAREAHQRRVDAAQEAATRAEQLAGRLEPAKLRLAAA
ncbi:hypothetical protein AN219_11995, partial [Streptomyces nanshensis]